MIKYIVFIVSFFVSLLFIAIGSHYNLFIEVFGILTMVLTILFTLMNGFFDLWSRYYSRKDKKVEIKEDSQIRFLGERH